MENIIFDIYIYIYIYIYVYIYIYIYIYMYIYLIDYKSVRTLGIAVFVTS